METLYSAAILNYIYQNGQIHLPRSLCYNNKVKKQAQVVEVEMFYFRVPPDTSSLLAGAALGEGAGGCLLRLPPGSGDPAPMRSVRPRVCPQLPWVSGGWLGSSSALMRGTDKAALPPRRGSRGHVSRSAASLVFCGKRHGPPQEK